VSQVLVTILKAVSQEDGQIEVEFSSQLGRAKGLWMDDFPKVEQSYDVEINIDDVLQWGVDISNTQEDKFMRQETESDLWLKGTLENYDEGEGLSIIRFGNSILMIDTTGDPEPIGSPVCMKVKTLKLFDTHI
jgi:hypothetical protein